MVVFDCMCNVQKFFLIEPTQQGWRTSKLLCCSLEFGSTRFDTLWNYPDRISLFTFYLRSILSDRGNIRNEIWSLVWESEFLCWKSSESVEK